MTSYKGQADGKEFIDSLESAFDQICTVIERSAPKEIKN